MNISKRHALLTWSAARKWAKEVLHSRGLDVPHNHPDLAIESFVVQLAPILEHQIVERTATGGVRERRAHPISGRIIDDACFHELKGPWVHICCYEVAACRASEWGFVELSKLRNRFHSYNRALFKDDCVAYPPLAAILKVETSLTRVQESHNRALCIDQYPGMARYVGLVSVDRCDPPRIIPEPLTRGAKQAEPKIWLMPLTEHINLEYEYFRIISVNLDTGEYEIHGFVKRDAYVRRLIEGAPFSDADCFADLPTAAKMLRYANMAHPSYEFPFPREHYSGVDDIIFSLHARLRQLQAIHKKQEDLLDESDFLATETSVDWEYLGLKCSLLCMLFPGLLSVSPRNENNKYNRHMTQNVRVTWWKLEQRLLYLRLISSLRDRVHEVFNTLATYDAHRRGVSPQSFMARRYTINEFRYSVLEDREWECIYANYDYTYPHVYRISFEHAFMFMGPNECYLRQGCAWVNPNQLALAASQLFTPGAYLSRRPELVKKYLQPYDFEPFNSVYSLREPYNQFKEIPTRLDVKLDDTEEETKAKEDEVAAHYLGMWSKCSKETMNAICYFYECMVKMIDPLVELKVKAATPVSAPTVRIREIEELDVVIKRLTPQCVQNLHKPAHIPSNHYPFFYSEMRYLGVDPSTLLAHREKAMKDHWRKNNANPDSQWKAFEQNVRTLMTSNKHQYQYGCESVQKLGLCPFVDGSTPFNPPNKRCTDTLNEPNLTHALYAPRRYIKMRQDQDRRRRIEIEQEDQKLAAAMDTMEMGFITVPLAPSPPSSSASSAAPSQTALADWQ